MRLTSLWDKNCSIARTLDVVGEWWTLLIVRDALRGTRRFEDFLSGSGMARGVLTARLRKLTENGILDRVLYSEHPPRYEYVLTPKGRALGPVLTSMMEWGDTWVPNPAGPPVVLVHTSCGAVMYPARICPSCGVLVTEGTVRTEPGPGAAASGSLRPCLGGLPYGGSASLRRVHAVL